MGERASTPTPIRQSGLRAGIQGVLGLPPAKAPALLPPPPTPSHPHPLPYPHAHPHAPGQPHPPTARRSCGGRNLALPVEGESRGGHPLWQGVWGMCPQLPKNSEGGRVGPTNVAMPTQVSPWPLLPQADGAAPPPCHLPLPPNPSDPLPYPPCAPRFGTAPPSEEELRRTRRWSRALGFVFVFLQIESRAWRAPSQLRIRKPNRMPPGHSPAPQPRATTPSAPNSHSSPTTYGVGAGHALLQGLPCLPCFPLSESGHFSPRPSAHVRPAPSQIRFVPLFRPFQHPQRGPRPLIRLVPGRYDLSPFVHLSIAPQTQAAPASSRHRPPRKNTPHNSNQFKSLPQPNAPAFAVTQ